MTPTINWDAMWCPELKAYCKGNSCSQMKVDSIDGTIKYCEINDVRWKKEQ